MEGKEVRFARSAWIELAESPSSEAALGLSPMSVLAHDLGAASLLTADASLRRRLSLNSQTASPTPTSPLLRTNRTNNNNQDNNVSFDSLPR